MYTDVTRERHYEMKGISGNRLSSLSTLRDIRSRKKASICTDHCLIIWKALLIVILSTLCSLNYPSFKAKNSSDVASFPGVTTHCGCIFTALYRGLASSFSRFLDHTQRRATVGRIPLDEWSIRRRDIYLTTHNTHNRLTSMPPMGFETTISAGEGPKTYAFGSAATETGRKTAVLSRNPCTISSWKWNVSAYAVKKGIRILHQQWFYLAW